MGRPSSWGWPGIFNSSCLPEPPGGLGKFHSSGYVPHPRSPNLWGQDPGIHIFLKNFLGGSNVQPTLEPLTSEALSGQHVLAVTQARGLGTVRHLSTGAQRNTGWTLDCVVLLEEPPKQVNCINRGSGAQGRGQCGESITLWLWESVSCDHGAGLPTAEGTASTPEGRQRDSSVSGPQRTAAPNDSALTPPPHDETVSLGAVLNPAVPGLSSMLPAFQTQAIITQKTTLDSHTVWNESSELPTHSPSRRKAENGGNHRFGDPPVVAGVSLLFKGRVGKDHIHAIQRPMNGINGKHFLAGKARESKKPPTAKFLQIHFHENSFLADTLRAGRHFPQ